MKLFVWDFHGVLEQGNERAAIAISNDILREFGYREQFTDDDAYRLTGLKWYQYFEDLLPHETYERHFELQAACHTHPDHRALIQKHIRPNDYAADVLTTIAQGHDQILISNTNPDIMHFFLESVGLHGYFSPEKVFATNHHRKDAKLSKADVLADYLQNKEYEAVVAIGDFPADVELVRQLPHGVSYLYTHSYLDFRDCNPTFRIRDLREVLREL